MLGLTLIVPAISFASCQNPTMPAQAIIRIKIINPETYITTRYDDKGNVKYTVKGEVSEGSIDYIKTIINEEDPQNYADGFEIITPLKKGWNYITASAVTSKGEDHTPAEDSVYSYSEEEGRDSIRDYLENANITYDESVDISLGASDSVHADFLCYLGEDRVVNYVGYGDDLTKDRENSELLNLLYGIPNYSWIRTPEEIGKSGLEEFVNGGS